MFRQSDFGISKIMQEAPIAATANLRDEKWVPLLRQVHKRLAALISTLVGSPGINGGCHPNAAKID
jgi:hypothetical protein